MYDFISAKGIFNIERALTRSTQLSTLKLYRGVWVNRTSGTFAASGTVDKAELSTKLYVHARADVFSWDRNKDFLRIKQTAKLPSHPLFTYSKFNGADKFNTKYLVGQTGTHAAAVPNATSYRTKHDIVNTRRLAGMVDMYGGGSKHGTLCWCYAGYLFTARKFFSFGVCTIAKLYGS